MNPRHVRPRLFTLQRSTRSSALASHPLDDDAGRDGAPDVGRGRAVHVTDGRAAPSRTDRSPPSTAPHPSSENSEQSAMRPRSGCAQPDRAVLDGTGLVERLHQIVGSFASRSAAARAIHRSEGVLRKWLRGRSEPLATDIQRLCEVSGCSAEWLIFGTDPSGRCEREDDSFHLNRKVRAAATGVTYGPITSKVHDPAFLARLTEVVRSFRTPLAAGHAIQRSESTVRKWLRGDSEPRASDIRQLCAASGFTAEWLIRGADLSAGGYEKNQSAAFCSDKSRTRSLPPM